MTRPFRFALTALVAAALMMPAAAGAQSIATSRLTILHTNDTHGHLLPFSYPALSSPGGGRDNLATRSNIGGIARRATLVARIRAELAARRTPVWLVDAGDFSDGTPFSTDYRGEADVAAMNATGYTLATLGNHEFNYELAQTRKLIGLATYPVLCANAIETATGRPLAVPSRVMTVGRVRVGVFGLITREAATYRAAREGVTIEDEIQAARRMVTALRKQADVIVLISHAGDEMDERMAAEVPGIDVIVGGHSHSRLPVGEFVWQSDELQVDRVNGTVIVQAHQWAGELGRLDLLFERSRSGGWHVARYRERLIPVTADIPDDPKVASVVAKFWDPIAPKYGEVVGRAAADFTSRGDDQAEYNLFTDAVRESLGVEIELENPGGIRSPLVAGPITTADLIAMDPFDNTVVTFTISGRDLRRVLQQFTPYVSGIRYRVQDGQVVDVSVGGKPLEDDRQYTGATNSYAAERYLEGIKSTNTGKARLGVVVDFVRRQQSVQPAYDGRRVIISTGRRSRYPSTQSR